MSLAAFSPHAAKPSPPHYHRQSQAPQKQHSQVQVQAEDHGDYTYNHYYYNHVAGQVVISPASTTTSADAAFPFTTGPTLPGQLYLLQQQQQQQQTNIGKEYPYRYHPNIHLKTQSKPHTSFYYVLPVLLLEFLALSLTRAVLPSILLHEYGSAVYLVLGSADCIRGLLAFVACPLFGKLSDTSKLGRKWSLFITVLGSCAPVCSLALVSWKSHHYSSSFSQDDFTASTTAQQVVDIAAATSTGETSVEEAWLSSSTTTMAANFTTATTTIDIPSSSTSSLVVEEMAMLLPPMAIPMFVVLLSLSGMFSSTFTLVFCYISDLIHIKQERVSAYGLALATFGLSFTIGPMMGGYLAQSNIQWVFTTSLFLTILNGFYIALILPESRLDLVQSTSSSSSPATSKKDTKNTTDDNDEYYEFSKSKASSKSLLSFWSPWESIQMILQDSFLRRVGQVAFLYYTGLWAVISTLSLYAVQHFHLSPSRLGELMSALGLCTMMAEAVLVRILVPAIGEKRSTKLGLLSFAGQCIILGFAYKEWHLFVCVLFSLLGNLVYPSLSSLVSNTVEPKSVGQALGAVNGVKALTEGFGPLLFGALMTMSEHSYFPGWPYWIAALFVLWAFHVANQLPNDDDPYYYDYCQNSASSGAAEMDKEYIHELEFKKRYPRQRRRRGRLQGHGQGQGKRPFPIQTTDETTTAMAKPTSNNYNEDDDNESNNHPFDEEEDDHDYDEDEDDEEPKMCSFLKLPPTPTRDDEDEEYQGLLVLSDVEESEEELKGAVMEDYEFVKLPSSPRFFGPPSPTKK